MKTYLTGLQSQVVSVYDKTKTTIAGRVSQKTINSQTVLGAPLTKFIDVQTDASIIPGHMYLSSNNRLYVLPSTLAINATNAVLLYNFNITTGATSYVGRINFNLNIPTGTITPRSFKVDDSNTSNIRIFVGATTSVTAYGGQFLINKVALTDFVPIGFPTIWTAIANDTKAVYNLSDSGGVGINNSVTALAGTTVPWTSSNNAINTKIFVHNGVSATHQYFVFDYASGPTMPSQTTTSPTVNASPTFTLTGHGYNANDPVVITANAPTGFTATTASAAQTVYFVRNPTANTFELSATSGGASINATSVTSSTAFVRAIGQSTSNFTLKTGNLPALTGTLLLTNSEYYAVPNHTSNSGQDCVFFATSTNLYLGRLSDLTSGTTSWPNLVTSNVIGSGIDYTAQTPAYAVFSNELDIAVFNTNTSVFTAKPVVNNVIKNSFGCLANTWMETQNHTTDQFTLVTVSGLEMNVGWILASGSTVGQRGIVVMDLKSDATYGSSYIISPVVATPNATLKLVQTIEQLFDLTASVEVQYRTAALSSDTIFNSATTGWTIIPTAQDLSSYALNNFTQFRLLFQSASSPATTPPQIAEIAYTVLQNSEISDNWAFNYANSTSGTPSRVAMELTQAYATSVPTLYFRWYDKVTGNLLGTANTVTDAANFSYSTDDGLNWLPLGTIPNTAGILIRYTFSSPPGIRVIPSIRES